MSPPSCCGSRAARPSPAHRRRRPAGLRPDPEAVSEADAEGFVSARRRSRWRRDAPARNRKVADDTRTRSRRSRPVHPGNGGRQRINGADGDDVLQAQRGVPRAGGTGTNAVYGGNGNDRLLGGGDYDDLFGEDGDDVLLAATFARTERSSRIARRRSRRATTACSSAVVRGARVRRPANEGGH
jgi:hypothetical protein